jgi:hypothetical protein
MLPDTNLTGLFHLATAGAFNGSVCGHQADGIRWTGTLWPQNLEPFFAQGICLFDAEQKLSNSPFAAFVEPILTARTALGPVGHNLLALYLASTDGAVRGLAVEGLITCIERDLLDVETFAGATRRLIADARFPATRWQRTFAQVARVTPHHAQQIAAIFMQVVQFDPDDLPRDLGGLLELLFELCVETRQKLSNPVTREFLSALRVGGKTATYSKRLLAL